MENADYELEMLEETSPDVTELHCLWCKYEGETQFFFEGVFPNEDSMNKAIKMDKKYATEDGTEVEHKWAKFNRVVDGP